MRIFVRSVAFIAISVLAHYSNAQFTYLSPMPGSKMNNLETSIILKTGKFIDATSLKNALITINGSLSGVHEASIKLARDNKTILVYPITKFSGGETVSVEIKDGIKNADGSKVSGASFQFRTHPEYTAAQKAAISSAYRQIKIDEYGLEGFESMFEGNENTANKMFCNHLPPFIIDATPGAYYDAPVFYRNQRIVDPLCHTMAIITSDGDSLYGYQDNDKGIDFKINDNGYITFYDYTDSSFNMIDSSYNLVKKLYMKNGYFPDEHECRIYPDGDYFLFCYDGQVMDMTQYGGVDSVVVVGCVVQELNADNEVIFQWSSWDHIDVTETNQSLTSAYPIDYVHGNSMDLDDDGNLLLSARHLDQISKIDLNTGDFIWRMGGVNNEFTFIDEVSSPKPFSYQHHFRRIGNGLYTMFDNGNNQIPERSTAKEYQLDQVNKTATLVWSYHHPLVDGKEVMGLAMGSVQILPNGNRFIDWGFRKYVNAADIPNFTEVDSAGNIVWEFWFIDSNYVSYRAFKMPWERCNVIADSSLISDSITFTSAHLHWGLNAKISNYSLEYKKCTEADWITVPIDTNYYSLEGLEENTCYDWRIKTWCDIYADSAYTTVHQFTTHDPLNNTTVVEAAMGSVSLYPNPATGQTDLIFISSRSIEADITVYNLLGGIVLHHTASAHEGVNNFNIDLAHFNSGTYTIELKSGGETTRKKLIVK